MRFSNSTTPVKEPLAYAKRGWLRLYVGIVFVILYLPIITLIVFSFNDSKRTIVWNGFTTRHYWKAWNNDSLIDAFINSMTIALASTIISTILGVMLAVMLWRFRFPFKSGFESLVALPIVVPEICMGVAMLAFYSRLTGFPTDWIWPLNLSAITAAHIAFSFPFVAIVVRSRLNGFNMELVEASRDLGASEWQTFWHVIYPFMKPAIIAGSLLAFTLSLDDFVVTFFTSGPDTLTFPVKVYSMVRFSVTPEVNAASTLLIVTTVFLTVLAVYFHSSDKNESGH